MAIYTPNLASLTGGGLQAQQQHPQLLATPDGADATLAPGLGGPTGAYYAPPQLVIDCCYAASWRLEVSLSGGGKTITVDETISRPDTNWGDFIYNAFTGADESYTNPDPPVSTENLLTLDVQIGYLLGSVPPYDDLAFAWAAPTAWWPGLTIGVEVQEPIFDEDDVLVEVLYTQGGTGFRASGGGASVGGAMGVTLTVSGVVLPMYYLAGGGTTAPITGTITLSPLSWLSVA